MAQSGDFARAAAALSASQHPHSPAMTQRRRRGTADQDPESAAERKKLRNRMSQQAFRQRQTTYIRELERRLERSAKSESERVSRLELENQHLREQLAAFISKLATAQVSLQSLSRLMRTALDDPDRPDAEETHSPEDTAATPDDHHGQPSTAAAALSDASAEQIVPMAADLPLSELDLVLRDSRQPSQPAKECALPPSAAPWDFQPTPSGAIDTFDPFQSSIRPLSSTGNPSKDAGRNGFLGDPTAYGDPTAGLPGVWSYNYQMGPGLYRSAMDRLSPGHGGFKPSNSHFSDHICYLRACVWNKWQAVGLPQPPRVRLQKLHLSLSLMFSMFNGLTRPLAMAWYTPTKWYYYVTDLTMYHINPTPEMHSRLHAKYRPSALQLTEAYPTIIDWCPFPALRDKLILMHSANPLLDEIILDIATAYVVETDISRLVDVKGPIPGYVRVWDLIQAMEDTDDRPDVLARAAQGDPNPPADSPHLRLPAPDIDSLFYNREYAELAFKATRMDIGVTTYKLDPTLFNKYPELYPDLYEGSSAVVAAGVPLKPSRPFSRTSIPPPPALEPHTLSVYRHFADWSVNVISNT